jgi:IS30 family transposase
MSLDDDIAQFLAQAESKPAVSKLEPYADLIRALRQRRWTYQQIAQVLRERFGLSVAVSTIHNFQKVRAKRQQRTTTDQYPMSQPALSSGAGKRSQSQRPRFHLDPL